MLKFKEYSLEFDAVAESIVLTDEEVTSVNEVMNLNKRLIKQNRIVRRRSRLTLQRKLQNMRVASPKRLNARARQRARRLIIQRLYNGRSRSQIPNAQRAQLDIRLKRMQGGIKSTSQRLLYRVRQDDRSRKTKYKNPQRVSTKRLQSF